MGCSDDGVSFVRDTPPGPATEMVLSPAAGRLPASHPGLSVAVEVVLVAVSGCWPWLVVHALWPSAVLLAVLVSLFVVAGAAGWCACSRQGRKRRRVGAVLLGRGRR